MKYTPMLAKIGELSNLEDDRFIFEPKLDGYRAICIVNKGIKILSRRGHNIAKQFPEFTFRKNIKAKSCVLDGEIIVYDEKGNPNFNMMQLRYTSDNIATKSIQTPATFAVFDILMKDGKSLMNLPLMERKKILKQTVKPGNHLEIVPWTTNGKKLWQQMRKRGLEGVVAKEKESTYKRTRSKVWLKIKFQHTIECTIVGYTTKKRAISSLALGLYKNKKLYYVGKVGTGFGSISLEKLRNKLEKLKITIPPVANPGRLRNIIWVKPKLTCEIKYQQFTKTEHLRIPVFLHLRDDKKPTECTFSQINKKK